MKPFAHRTALALAALGILSARATAQTDTNSTLLQARTTLAAAAPAALVPVAPAAPVAVPFAVGERLDYTVDFGPLTVGRASLVVGAMDTVRGIDAWHTIFTVKGGTFFYQVNDRMESWIDPQTFTSLRFHQDLREGGQHRDHSFEIFPNRKLFSEDGRAPQPSVRAPLDDASFLYFVRTVPLEIGHEYSFDRYFRPDRNPVRLIVLRRERITVPAGTFDAIVVRPIIKTRGIFSENGQAEVWLSDDSSRMMLQWKSQLSFGSLNLYLRKYTK